MGRRKIKIEKIQDKKRLQVCFSKRRTGLFKKAKQLSSLAGDHIAIIVFSPAGKPFALGDPAVEAIIERYEKESVFFPEQHRIALNFYLREDVNINAIDDVGELEKLEAGLKQFRDNVSSRIAELQTSTVITDETSGENPEDENLPDFPEALAAEFSEIPLELFYEDVMSCDQEISGLITEEEIAKNPVEYLNLSEYPDANVIGLSPFSSSSALESISSFNFDCHVEPVFDDDMEELLAMFS